MISGDRIRRAFSGAPTLVWFFVLLAGAEMGAAVLLPLVVPMSTYVDWFQPPQAEESIRRFLVGDHLLEPDPVAGWRSSPMRTEGLWQTDERGARGPGAGTWGDEGLTRIMLLGSSMMNGTTAVSYAETISAELERDGFAALNFGTMMYGLDQSLLAYQSRLGGLGADVVVVGIDADPHGPLSNVWVPLRRPSEIHTPFVKPRYTFADGVLEPVSIDPAALLGSENRDSLLDVVRRHGGYFNRFDRFVRFEQTPALAFLAWGLSGIERRLTGFETREDEQQLLDELLRVIRAEVERAGARLLLVAMPLGQGEHPERQVAALRDRVAGWRAQGFDVVDVADLFSGIGISESTLYIADGVHLSAVGNATVANAIADLVSDGR
jgi:hypothetical protein